MVLLLTLISHIVVLLTRSSCRKRTWVNELCAEDLCSNQIPHVTCSKLRYTNCTAVDFPDETQVNASRRAMLHSFNQFRNSWAGGYGLDYSGIFPGASNMHQVVWSDELESYARTACSRCLVEFGDDCRDSIEGTVGQLFYLKLFNKERPPGDAEVFNTWILDSTYLTPAAVKNYSTFSNNLSSPSVMFWKLREIGCSSASITLLNSSSGRLVICNIYPSGPIYGWPIYRGGNACDECAIGFRCKEDSKYPMLCDEYLPSVAETVTDKNDALLCKNFNMFALSCAFVNIIGQCHKPRLQL